MRRYWRWRRELYLARRDQYQAWDRWQRARYFYEDSCEIFKDQPGAWHNGGPCGKAMDDLMETIEAHKAAIRKVERLERIGPT